MTAAELGARLREDREALGIGIGTLADGLGVHRRTLERWESGAIRPSRSKLRVIALLLNQPNERYREAP